MAMLLELIPEALEKEGSCSPPSHSPSTPSLDSDLRTPYIVKSNENRRVVGVGSAGKTPKEVRVVELTPNAVRKARDYGPPSITFDSGFEPVDDIPMKHSKPAQNHGRGGKKKRGKRKGRKK